MRIVGRRRSPVALLAALVIGISVAASARDSSQTLQQLSDDMGLVESTETQLADDEYVCSGEDYDKGYECPPDPVRRATRPSVIFSASNDECDCRIIEYVDVCGLNDPSTCAAE